MLKPTRILKSGLSIIILSLVAGSSFSSRAYPPFLKLAAKFGAKDCTFCHLEKEGGEGWNERGKWLIAEKDRRHADAIDVEWLKEFKEAEKAGGEVGKDEGKAKESDKETEKETGKEADKKPPKKPEKPEDPRLQ
jgi:hypothetical protein